MDTQAQFLDPILTNTYFSQTCQLKDDETIFSLENTSDSFYIGNKTFYYVGKERKGVGNLEETNIICFDQFMKLKRLLNFRTNNAIVTFVNGFLRNDNIYYFIISSLDTVFTKDTFFIKPVNFFYPYHLFKYDLEKDSLEYCKAIEGGLEFVYIYADQSDIYLEIRYGGSAKIDSFVFRPYHANIHESDILIVRLDAKNYHVKSATTVTGPLDSYPQAISAGQEGVTYSAMNLFSPFCFIHGDSIQLSTNNLGRDALIKLPNDQQWYKYHLSTGYFGNGISSSDQSFYVINNFYNHLNLDDQILKQNFLRRDGVIIKFDNNFDYQQMITFEGDGNKELKLIIPWKDKGLIVAGNFDITMVDEQHQMVKSESKMDNFVYFMNFSGEIQHSFFFQGDSTKELLDITELENGDYKLFGIMRGNHIRCHSDSLSNIKTSKEYQNTYFQYVINKNILNKVDVAGKNEIKFSLFPNPVQDQLQITFDDNINKLIQYEIHDISDRIVEKAKILEYNKTFKISVQKLLPGVYNLILINQKGLNYSNKFIKE